MSAQYTKTGCNSAIDYTVTVEIDKVIKADEPTLLGLVACSVSDFIARRQSVWMKNAKDGKAVITSEMFLTACREIGSAEHKAQKSTAESLLERVNRGEVSWEEIEEKSKVTAKTLGIKPIASRDFEGLFFYLVAKANAEAAKESNPALRAI